MNRDRAEALAKSIKESYRRLEFGSNDVRIKQETDGLIDQLVALVPAPAPQPLRKQLPFFGDGE